MIDRDYEAFCQEFRRLVLALERYRMSPQEADAKADAYFHVLKKYPLTLVVQKADQWLASESKMPKPAEWAGVIVQGRSEAIPVLTAVEADDWLRAERLRWEDTPCGCAECVQASVNEKARRFLPDVLPDGRDRRAQLGERIVVTGHWAHGFELFRFADARAQFWNDAIAKFGALDDGYTKRKRDAPLAERLLRIVQRAETVIAPESAR